MNLEDPILGAYHSLPPRPLANPIVDGTRSLLVQLAVAVSLP